MYPICVLGERRLPLASTLQSASRLATLSPFAKPLPGLDFRVCKMTPPTTLPAVAFLRALLDSSGAQRAPDLIDLRPPRRPLLPAPREQESFRR